ncbi:MAG: endonuclease III domain-containing protein [Planctomycetaceae bacterium]|nr:endonuclease III domain-containing protein [Planctomycetaceae bacterium]
MSALMEAFELLQQAYGAQHWWPAESTFEVIAGTILTQNTNWKNVERALKNLRDENVLDLDAMRDVPITALAELIRPAGYFRQKSKRLHNFIRFLDENYAGDLDLMFEDSVDSLREKLLSINGIGPETADSILLYAGQLPTFVVDTYTARLFKRHGWSEAEADYYALQSTAEQGLPQDVNLYNEFHALIVHVGKLHCRKIAQCDGCPLQSVLPTSGPLVPNL